MINHSSFKHNLKKLKKKNLIFLTLVSQKKVL